VEADHAGGGNDQGDGTGKAGDGADTGIAGDGANIGRASDGATATEDAALDGAGNSREPKV
jgi:hypothetical protein